MMAIEKHMLINDNYDAVFNHVCAQSERYCDEKGIVPPTPEDADAFDKYNNYLNEVTYNAINDIISMLEDEGMTGEEAAVAFNSIAIDKFIDLDSVQF